MVNDFQFLRMRMSPSTYAPIKRGMDVFLSLLLLMLLSPLMLGIALAIRLTSPGPVFYRQVRVGRNGKEFEMLKFRSMSANASSKVHEEHIRKLIEQDLSGEAAAATKIENDSRITRIGAILRKLSLDELPQFINVLCGDMSLVGPRPSIPYEVALFKDWYMERFTVLPGITGLWQVVGRSSVAFDDMVKLDIQYVHTMNLLLDLWILLKTPRAMVKGSG
jgi:lipopolysaccharide/colanic/teichoic acid biosynthesis glycosyltransferase